MMERPLLISGLLEHAATIHAVHQFRSNLTDCDGGVVSERRH
jgi:hypothetical protein